MKIGFIGLGIMGKPMCRNLMKNGHEMVVYNRSSASMEELAKEGAVMAKSPAELAAECETIITMVPSLSECQRRSTFRKWHYQRCKTRNGPD